MATDLEQTGFPQAVQDVESVIQDPSVDNFRKELKEARHKEIVALTSVFGTVSARFPSTFFSPIPAYARYLWATWTNIAYVASTLETPFLDWLTLTLTALLTSTFLGWALLWCQFASLPPVQWIYWLWSEKFGGDLGLVNYLTPNLFKTLLPEQIAAADDSLSVPSESHAPTGSTDPVIREFNLDIAKLLVQISAIVYERKSDAIYETVEKTAKSHGDKSKLKVGANVQQFRDALTSAFTDDTLIRDVAKLGKLGFNKHQWGTDVIGDFCKKTGLSYVPVSELNSSTSAFCSFFWKTGGNWIVVAFKGTGPTDYPDYVADLTTRMVHVDEFLPTFSQVIKGFKDRIWPSKLQSILEIEGRKRSWEQIRKMLILLANDLVKQQPAGEKINVWFTGHSLGCALAGLAYTRSISSSEDFAGSPIVVRDAYVFGAPVIGNRPTSQRFNVVISKGEEVKTLWRVTNHNDIVATGLPQLGDNPDLELTTTNPLGFAHIGAEIKMLDYPTPSQFAGTLYNRNSVVRVTSKFSAEDLKEQRERQLAVHPDWKRRVGLGNFVQKIPLAGRLFAHLAGLYWNQLAVMAPVQCIWVKGY
ncbi:Alpha/Beta hydrolase protein [Cantharellus anzutake]|uniref:Alpha/Beta hydrolase protein n=1 Tax=Cantharellus anzutake TaxID=1750568 RepID=UPI001906834C|nr:Alpha/Beta hydrolase protein [Cantharellus anzutake]KAF8309378.1 Alpha/Beta hydrolase protein [Cantharellus anzutake]